MRSKLLAARETRVAPAKDDKVLTAWNGLMISAMARGAQVTGDVRYTQAAIASAKFILTEMRDGAGGLLHSWRGGQAKVGGFLEDYANLTAGLIDIYETTFDVQWLHEADALAAGLLERFSDDEGGGFFSTDGCDTTVILRLKEYYDGAMPSGNSAAVHALTRLGRLLDREAYRKAARRTMESIAKAMDHLPDAYHHMISAVAGELGPSREIVIAGDPDTPETRELIEGLRALYLPGVVLAVGRDDASGLIGLLNGKVTVDGRPSMYVCENFSCHAPVFTLEAMRSLLGGKS
jgi:uncharacterized protein YyaL (SSP411 family)